MPAQNGWPLSAMPSILKNMQKQHIPTKLDEFGVKKEDLDFLVKAGSQQTRLLVNNCKELSLDDIRYLYEKLF